VSRLVAIGEPLAVFTAASTGPVRIGDHFRIGLGGAECNVAVACRRLGVAAAVIGVVGDDPLGGALLRALRADDVDVSGIAVEPGGFTGIMVKEMRTAGRVRIGYARSGSAGSGIAPRHLAPAVLDGATILHSTGVTASFGGPARAALAEAGARVQGAGGLVSFDVNYRSRLWPDRESAREALRSLASAADLVFLGAAEADILLGGGAGETPEEVLRAVAALGPSQVVYRSEGTATALVHGEVSTAAGTPAVVVDPVGAGDAFAAGYLAELLRGADVAVRLRAAHALGRWAVTTHGDHDGVPYRDELAAWGEDDVLR
jgi:2-dehydro-3-deoxygluconokinase